MEEEERGQRVNEQSTLYTSMKMSRIYLLFIQLIHANTRRKISLVRQTLNLGNNFIISSMFLIWP